MKNSTFSIFFILVYFITKPLFAQYAEQEQTTVFSNRLKSPIKITVLNKDRKYIFYADNKSYYSYSITIVYDLTNLRPMMTEKNYVVGRGRTRLASFEIKDEFASVNYSYKYNFRIQGTGKEFFNESPYLFPIGKNKLISEYFPELFFRNRVRLENVTNSDTVYCMRKGIVSAKPNVSLEIDKISSTNSAIEIIHEDGSVMVYTGLDSENLFISLGEKVYPREALGLLQGVALTTDLYTITEEGTISSQKITFYSDKTNAVKTYEEIGDERSVYPIEIIMREMTATEKRKMKKGKLY